MGVALKLAETGLIHIYSKGKQHGILAEDSNPLVRCCAGSAGELSNGKLPCKPLPPNIRRFNL